MLNTQPILPFLICPSQLYLAILTENVGIQNGVVRISHFEESFRAGTLESDGDGDTYTSAVDVIMEFVPSMVHTAATTTTTTTRTTQG